MLRKLVTRGLLTVAVTGHPPGWMAITPPTAPISVAPVLIAVTADRHGMDVLHRDRDFEHIRAITGQRMHWVVPPGAVP